MYYLKHLWAILCQDTASKKVCLFDILSQAPSAKDHPLPGWSKGLLRTYINIRFGPSPFACMSMHVELTGKPAKDTFAEGACDNIRITLTILLIDSSSHFLPYSLVGLHIS